MREADRSADPTVDQMTVEGEIDKLAHNVAMGRNWASIHYRTEMEQSLFLGEATALALLRAKVCEYYIARTESSRGWTHLFNGTRVTLRDCEWSGDGSDQGGGDDDGAPGCHRLPGSQHPRHRGQS